MARLAFHTFSRRVAELRAVDEGAVPANAPATSRLFVLPVATRRWVSTDNSMPPQHPPCQHEFVLELNSSNARSGPKPKMDFPKFNGTNLPWKDKCKLFFEVFGVRESFKSRFAALNFIGTAKSWLHIFERRQRVGSWEELHKAALKEIC